MENLCVLMKRENGGTICVRREDRSTRATMVDKAGRASNTVTIDEAREAR